MLSYQRDFIELAIAHGVLCFGEFKLKSGRTSPYFFNAGRFHTGSALSTLARVYSAAIHHSGLKFDLLFGAAYKGIPLAAATSMGLMEQYNIDKPYCFNRKEAKGHGEGGMLVGAPLQGKVLIVDDVITAGTAVREVIDLIKAQGAEPAGLLIGLNRQERGKAQRSAIQELEDDYGIQVISIISLADIIGYMESLEDRAEIVEKIKSYYALYGVR